MTSLRFPAPPPRGAVNTFCAIDSSPHALLGEQLPCFFIGWFCWVPACSRHGSISSMTTATVVFDDIGGREVMGEGSDHEKGHGRSGNRAPPRLGPAPALSRPLVRGLRRRQRRSQLRVLSACPVPGAAGLRQCRGQAASFLRPHVLPATPTGLHSHGDAPSS